ncbi:RING-type E3 ubiquitin transferase [Theileria orientalis]|uniref:E3 ubiquitin-protein ligase CHIP n=1 Tax=Theileria orientalis TaxID=68886 RepID=A0A976M3R4_THEOR|nr:RING-type E3 ubiquitin transferase [Theileria orientalis]
MEEKVEEKEAQDRELDTLDSIEYNKPDSSYNISFKELDHAIYSATSNVEFPKDRNLIKKAEDYRNLGNESFKRGFTELAIEYYTKAITTYPKNHEFYTNRAVCYKRKGDWLKVEADVRQALNLEENSVKAHYFLGQALLNLGKLVKLRKAKCLSEHYKTVHTEEINNEILRSIMKLYLEEEARLNYAVESLSSYVKELLERENNQGALSEQEYSERVKQLEMINDYVKKTQEREIPKYLCCKISMCLMRDPVITPSGQTYERELIEKHIMNNGCFDPVTRKPCKLSDLYPNYYLKEAVESFLEKNPWAYDEYYTQ